jgi:hypothetical protein
MADNIFSDNSIKRDLEKLEDVPKEEANIGVVVEGGDVGVTGSVSKDLGKPGGWDVAAEGTWMRRTGAKLAALLRWKGNSE